MKLRQTVTTMVIATLVQGVGHAQPTQSLSGQVLLLSPSQMSDASPIHPLALGPPPIGMFGRGFDSATGRLLPKICVPMERLVSKGGPVTAGSGQHFFNEVTSLTDVLDASSTSASVSVLYDGVNAGVGGQIANGSFGSSFGRYVVAYARVIIDELEARGRGPNGDPAFAEGILADVKDRKLFRTECGDHYVSGYQLGGVLSVVANIKAKQDGTWTANKLNVSVGISGIFGADFSKSEKHQSFMASSTTTIRDLSEGVVTPNVTLDNLYEVVNNYTQRVIEKPELVSYVFTPYSALGRQAADLPDFTELESVEVSMLARKRDLARVRRNDLEDAINAQAATPKIMTITGDIPTLSSDLDKYLEQIAMAADACRKATTAEQCTAAIHLVGVVPPSGVTISTP